MKKRLLPVTIFALLLVGIFIQYEFNGDSLDKMEEEARKTQNIDEIELTKGAYTKILKGNEVKNAEYYQLLKGNKVIKKVAMLI